jgi:hypothetical protein
MNDFVMKGAEAGTILQVMKRLGFVGMGFGGLNQDEFIHHLLQLMQAQFQQFQFVEEGKTIVNHAGDEPFPLAVCFLTDFNCRFTPSKLQMNVFQPQN